MYSTEEEAVTTDDGVQHGTPHGGAEVIEPAANVPSCSAADGDVDEHITIGDEEPGYGYGV